MTPLTIGCTIICKLLCMSVGVATFTVLSSLSELLAYYPAVVLPEVAVAARFPLVGSGKTEVGIFVIEGDGRPPGFIMTIFTTGVGKIFFADQPLVNVFVTIETAQADFPEFPDSVIFSSAFDMANNAGDGQVGSFQLERTLIVLLKGEIKI